MSDKKIILSDTKTDPKVICHSIPCKVIEDCEAEVDKYFAPTIRQSDKKEVLLSSFRGRPLVGRSIDLPDNCRAFVVKDNTSSDFVANECFQRITHWNFDKNPSESDSLQQTIEWINISNAIHSPIPSKESIDKN